MKKKVKENWFKRVFSSSWFFVTILILLIIFSFALINEMARKVEIKREIQSLEARVNELEGGNDELSSLISYFQTEEFITKEARTKLGFKKLGETVIAVPTGSIEVELTDNQKSEENQENWKLWRSYFFEN